MYLPSVIVKEAQTILAAIVEVPTYPHLDTYIHTYIPSIRTRDRHLIIIIIGPPTYIHTYIPWVHVWQLPYGCYRQQT